MMRKYLVTPRKGKPSRPKDPPKAPRTQKKTLLAGPLSDYDGDDYNGQMDYNKRESPQPDRPASPDYDDEFPAMPVRPEGNDITTPAFQKYFADAFEGLYFYKREAIIAKIRIDKVETQQQRLKKEVSDTFDSHNSRIASLEKQLLAINSEKIAKNMDDSIQSSLSTLIVYDISKVPGFDMKTDFTQS